MTENLKQIQRPCFQAQFDLVRSSHSLNGPTTVTMVHKGHLYVDSFGREREDTFILHDSKWEYLYSNIWDPVDLKMYILAGELHAILDEEVLDPNDMRRQLGIEIIPGGDEHYIFPRHLPRNYDNFMDEAADGLKHKQFRTRSSPRSEEVTIDCYYNEKISYLVRVQIIFSDLEITYRLFDIMLVEPSQELFVIKPDCEHRR